MPVVRKTPAKTVPVVAKAVAKPAGKANTLPVGTPEAKEASGNKRKRLSKAFPRPLDKKLKRNAVVRDCFTFPEVEYAYLVELKKRLQAEGVEIKKSELLRAGLVLLSSLEDADMKVLLAKVPRVS
ncbi:MAG: hypothetical protein WCK63_09855 [Betaproteobacteria bacterium]